MPRARYLHRTKKHNYACEVPGCNFKAYMATQLRKHLFTKHDCSKCGKTFPNRFEHDCQETATSETKISDDFSSFKLISHAHHHRLHTYRSTATTGIADLTSLFTEMDSSVSKVLCYNLSQHKGLRVEIITKVKLFQPQQNIFKDTYLSSGSMPLTHVNFIDSLYKLALSHQQNILELFTSENSGWTLFSIYYLELSLGKYSPLEVKGHIELPQCFRNKKGLLNIENEGSLCFAFCIAAKFFPCKGDIRAARKPKQYRQYFSKFNFTMLDFPVKVKDLSKFENANNLSINIYHYEEHENKFNLYPVLLTKKIIEREKHVDLLVIDNEKESHFVLITNLSALLGNPHLKYDVCRYCLRKHLCRSALERHVKRCVENEIDNSDEESVAMELDNPDDRYKACKKCLYNYNSISPLQAHEALCRAIKGPMIKFPTEGCIEFKKFNQAFPVPNIVFADIEAFLVPLTNQKQGNSITKNEHVAASYSYYVVGDEGIISSKVYDGPNPIQNMIESLLVEADEYQKRLELNEALEMSEHDEINFELSTFCNLCKKDFDIDIPDLKKVRHHAHSLTEYKGVTYQKGAFIAAICNKCNLYLKPCKKLTVLLHNSMRYDNKHIVQALHPSFLKKCKVDLLAKSKEHFLCIEVENKIKIMDSIQHLRTSLDQLVKNLVITGKENFKITKEAFPNFTENEMDDILQKQIFPYSYMTGPNVLLEKELPPIEAFYNDLTDEPCSEENYAHAQKMFELFECENFGDYAKVYLQLDTTLLADVFLYYRKTMLKEFHLDPVHCITSSSYTWQIFLYCTGAKIDYIEDHDMYIMVKRGLKGGICNSNKKIAQSNVKGTLNFNESKEENMLLFTDMNSQYPHVMQQPVPYRNYVFLSEQECIDFDFEKLDQQPKGVGYIFDVDIIYDDALQLATALLPLAPHKLNINVQEMSEYQKDLAHQVGIKNVDAAERLLLTLFDKEGYIVHHELLRYYLQKGLKVKRANKIIKFDEAPIMADHVRKLVKMRADCPFPSMAAALKILTNALYGITLLSPTAFIQLLFCMDAETCERLLRKATYKSHVIINEDVSLIEIKPTSCLYTSAMMIGHTIMDNAKLELYKMYYDVLSPHFNNRIELILCDTDSLLVQVYLPPGRTWLDMMEGLSPWMDYSNLDKDSPFFSLKNAQHKGVSGYWKLEYEGLTIQEVVSLKLKMYSVLLHNCREINKGKGIGKSALRKLLHENYVNAVYQPGERIEMTMIKSQKQRLYTIVVNKATLHAFSAHRYIMEDGINSLPWGYNPEIFNIDTVAI